LKLTLVVLSVGLLTAFASASTVDFNSYSPLDSCSSSISSGGLDFNGTVSCAGSYMYVWDGSSPNGNGTPALIFAGFGTGSTMTITQTGGGTFNLTSVDMTISWYDGNPSEVVLVNGNPITLIQGLQNYNLNLLGVTSVTFSDVSSGSGYWLMDNVVYNATPEPGTLAMFGSGIIGLAGMLRRKINL
jgi:PEP-CTERM motif